MTTCGGRTTICSASGCLPSYANDCTDSWTHPTKPSRSDVMPAKSIKDEKVLAELDVKHPKAEVQANKASDIASKVAATSASFAARRSAVEQLAVAAKEPLFPPRSSATPARAPLQEPDQLPGGLTDRLAVLLLTLEDIFRRRFELHVLEVDAKEGKASILSSGSCSSADFSRMPMMYPMLPSPRTKSDLIKSTGSLQPVESRKCTSMVPAVNSAALMDTS
mmetsp:Transcript_21323/g.49523  ORF Transcript_21323/g.49523 Transcript_21323/m.49523 type:complete len:221 (-) Transcript_21323:1192-1854(-)